MVRSPSPSGTLAAPVLRASHIRRSTSRFHSSSILTAALSTAALQSLRLHSLPFPARGREIPMRRSTSAAATPPASPATTSPKPGATKRQRKSVPLCDVTNLLLLRPETPTPIKPRRTTRRPLPAPSDASTASSTCSSSAASVTPALKPSSSASATPALNPSSSSAAPVTTALPTALQPSSSATPTAAQRPPSTVSATPAPRPSSAASATPAPPEPSSAATATPAPPGPSSAATATPAPKRSFAAELSEEGSVFESPTICTVYARRRTTEVQVEVERRSNLRVTNKGKEPVRASASCPAHGKSTTNIRKKNTRTISSSAPCHEAKKKRPLATTLKLPEEFVKKQKAYFADVDAFELAEEEVSESELE